MPSMFISVRSSYMNPATSAWRSAGFLAVALATISSARSSSASSTRLDGAGMVWCSCASKTSSSVPPNGSRPVNSSNITTPSA